MKIRLLRFLLPVLVCVACKKDDDNPPAPDDAVATLVRQTNSGRVDLWYLRSDGANFTQLTSDDLGNYLSSPAWSFDGRKIFFAVNTPSTNRNGVYSITSNGKDLKTIYKDNDTQSRRFTQVVASKDEEHVVVSLTIPRATRNVTELYRMCPCGQRVTRLTSFETMQSPTLVNTESYAGSFSRDSRYLYFVQSDPTISGPKAVNLFRLEMATNQLKLIRTFTVSDVLGAVPSISPDGKRILLSIDGEIKLMNEDGSQLTTLPVTGYRPSWDKNSSDFYFSLPVSTPTLKSGIYRTNPALSEIKAISRNSTAWEFGGLSINN